LETVLDLQEEGIAERQLRKADLAVIFRELFS